MKVKFVEDYRKTCDYFACMGTARFLQEKCRWDLQESPMVKPDLLAILKHEIVPEEIKHCEFNQKQIRNLLGLFQCMIFITIIF